MGCHGRSWAEGHFAKLDRANEQADGMVLAATQLMQHVWSEGKADPENPFDELVERHWVQQWLFYANSVRYAAAMSGPDYAAFKNGWWDLTKNLERLSSHVSKKTHD